MKQILGILLILLTSCVMKPPVQEMSNARSAIKTAHELPGQSTRADVRLKSAERALEEAEQAIREERYEKARTKALEARRNAQEAARIKQIQKN